jgi:hypothetical protein
MGYTYGPIMGAWVSNRPFFTFCFRAPLAQQGIAQHSTLLDLFSIAGSLFYSFILLSFGYDLANFVIDSVYPASPVLAKNSWENQSVEDNGAALLRSCCCR